MDAERWEKIESLYHAALQREAAEREDFLLAACEDDKSLLGEVKTLLMFQEKNNTFLENPALNQAAKLLVTHQNQLAFGQTFANYKVLTLLGAGGMGEVYLAEDVLLGRKVALKVLPLSLTHNPNLVGRFQKEARSASVLNHPNILTIYEVGQDKSGLNYIATEYIEGETLRQMMSGGKDFSLEQILDIAVQITSGLSAAHQAGVIHRDIKPQNVMVRKDGYVKILDFGIAKLTENPKKDDKEPSSLRTDTGMILGTANYMSPEQARGLKVDARTDIWSLGVTLYELITRQAPFTGNTTTDIIVSILERNPLPVSDFVADAPPELIRIINKCLEKDVANRYQTADQAAADLRKLIESPQSKGFLKINSRPTSDDARVITAENNQTTANEQVVQGESRHYNDEQSSSFFIKHIFRPSAGVAVILLTFLVGIVLTYPANSLKWTNRLGFWSSPATSFQNAKPNRLTTSGNVIQSHVSPDGKYVAYVEQEAGQHSLWVGQIAAPPARQIIEPTGNSYRGLTFSPDSNFIYYTVHEREKGKGVLYSISVMGSEPRRILDDVDSPVAFSPDGKSFAFVRDDNDGGVLGYAVIIADTATAELRKLAVHKDPDFFAYDRFTWSGDGKSIIIPSIKASNVPAKYVRLVEVNVADGSEKVLGSHQWNEISSVSWFGKNNLVITAAEQSAKSQIYQVSYPSGEVQQITNDLSFYRDVSASANGKIVLAVEHDQISHIWTASANNPNEFKRATSGIGRYHQASWTPDGKIIYTSEESGNQDIWVMNSDGTNPKQLTFDRAADNFPKMSPDKRYIVFSSNRTGVTNLWRMDSDGGNQTRLTNGTNDSRAYFSADGQFIYFSSIQSDQWFLSKISINGGDAAQLLENPSLNPAVSPDGQWIVCEYVNKAINSEWQLGIVSTVSEKIEKSLDRPIRGSRLISRWSPDGKSLTFLDSLNNQYNLWSYNLENHTRKQLTNLNSSDEILYYDWSLNGKDIVFLRGNKTNDVIYITNSSD